MSDESLSAVIDRVQCLTGLLTRAQVEEQLLAGGDAGRWTGVLERLVAWVEQERLVDLLTDDERGLLTRPVGSWPDDAVISVSWRIEALGVLLWATSRLKEAPPAWQPAAADDVPAWPRSRRSSPGAATASTSSCRRRSPRSATAAAC